MLKKKFFCLISFIFLFWAYGLSTVSTDSSFLIWTDNNIIDSVRFNAINSYYKTHTFSEPDEVIKLTDYHFNLAKNKGFTKEMAKALNEKSFAWYLKGDLEKARHSLEKAISILESIKEDSDVATFYVNLGNIYLEENNYQEAVKKFTQGLHSFQENGQKLREATVLSNLGLIFLDIESYELALKYLLEAEKVYSQNGFEKDMGSTLLLIGTVHYKRGSFSKSLSYGERALELLQESNNIIAIAECYSLFANVNEKLGDKKAALTFLNKSLETDQEIGNKPKNLSRLIYKLSLTSQINLVYPINEAEKLLKEVLQTEDPEIKASLYELLHFWYKKEGNYNLALEMHENYVRYSDTIQLLKSKTTLVRNAIQNDFEEKLYQTKLENEKQQAEIKINNLNRTYLILLLSVIILLSIFLYYQHVLGKNKKLRIELLEELERLKKLDSTLVAGSTSFNLNREKIESRIQRKLNDTDWKVLSILVEDPVISNKGIAEKAYLSVDGIGSSLRRMYEYFDIKESKYKKISLLLEAIKISNS